MGVEATYTTHLVEYNGVVIRGISDQNWDPQSNNVSMSGDGQVNTHFTGITFQEPQVTLTTLSIAQALDAMGSICGAPIDDGGAGIANFYAKKRELEGKISAGATHFRMAMNNGLLYPTTISANQDNQATMSLVAASRYNGTDDPFVYTNNVALPSPAGAFEMFTVGPGRVNGTMLPGIQSFELDNGLEVVQRRGDGDPWTTHIAIRKHRPILTLQLTDPVKMSDFTLCGTAENPAAGPENDSRIYLRGIQNMQKPYADASAEHIRFDLETFHVLPTGTEFSDDDDATTTLRLELLSNDAGDAPIAFVTGQAIDFPVP